MASLSLNWFSEFFNIVEQHQTITVFHHVAPDGDAYGSSLGLAAFLREKYPDKKVYVGGLETGSLAHFFGSMELLSDEVIAGSLSIITDTANADRIDDKRALSAKESIRIDHHPSDDFYATHNYQEAHISSCSEIVARLCLSTQEVLSETVARYLYAGMLTDTLSFSISSVNSDTLLVASKLLKSGFNLSDLHDSLFQIEDNVYDYISHLRTLSVENELGLVYAIVNQDVINRFNLTINQAKEVVNVFREKQSARIWMLVIEESTDNYRTTIRSRGVVINDIASEFGGGGHVFACATKNLNLRQVAQLIEKLNERLKLTER